MGLFGDELNRKAIWFRREIPALTDNITDSAAPLFMDVKVKEWISNSIISEINEDEKQYPCSFITDLVLSPHLVITL